MSTIDYTPATIAKLPLLPGVYHFYNATGRLLYVGKAKLLRKRVKSYFQGSDHPLKVVQMVRQINKISIVLVNSAYEALLLESNLIKTHQPPYNVLLKDGKRYPYLCVTHERFPRLITTRVRDPELGRYFGPFTSGKQRLELEGLIRAHYPLRSCTYNLSASNIAAKKFTPCLEYHLGNCHAPCIGKQHVASYQAMVEEVVELLKGDFKALKKRLKQSMQAASAAQDYHSARTYQLRLEAINAYQASSPIDHPRLGDLDVIALAGVAPRQVIHYFSLTQGRLYFAQTIEVKSTLEELPQGLLALALCRFREAAKSKATKVLSHHPITPLPQGVTLFKPQKGACKQLLDLALKNAFFFQREALATTNQRPSGPPLLALLQAALELPRLPLQIECIDNAHLQGSHPVAALVCFHQGKPAKKNYRHYHLKVDNGDDYAAMREIVGRRYQQQHRCFPDLLLLDGGKGQLYAAHAALKAAGLENKIPLAALAKGSENLYSVGNPAPLKLDKKSASFHLLQSIRNEAHRFATTFHCHQRQKSGLQGVLEGIPNIGPKSSEKLLHHFGNLKAIRSASIEALMPLIGKKKATALKAFLR